jgi:hypothetical protein
MSIERVERALAASTEGQWFACTWDAMEVPHVSIVNGDHHPSKDVARDMRAVDARLIAATHNLLPRFIDVVRAAEAYDPGRVHDWRCEYRTAEVGWQQGDPPVIRCECGHDELVAALAALDAAIQEELPKEGSDDQ